MMLRALSAPRGIGAAVTAQPIAPPLPTALAESIASGMNEASVPGSCLPPGAGIAPYPGQVYCDTGSTIPSGSDLITPTVTNASAVTGATNTATGTGTDMSSYLLYGALALALWFFFGSKH
jgi:hypothetical protein